MLKEVLAIFCVAVLALLLAANARAAEHKKVEKMVEKTEQKTAARIHKAPGKHEARPQQPTTSAKVKRRNQPKFHKLPGRPHAPHVRTHVAQQQPAPPPIEIPPEKEERVAHTSGTIGPSAEQRARNSKNDEEALRRIRDVVRNFCDKHGDGRCQRHLLDAPKPPIKTGGFYLRDLGGQVQCS